MEPKDTVSTTNYKHFTNYGCEFYPCHEMPEGQELNCLFCYCPLAFLECDGPYEVIESPEGVFRKDCSGCTLTHSPGGWEYVQAKMKHPIIWLEMEKV